MMESTTYKSISRDFLHLSAKGNSREAFSRYVGKGFIHHNAYFTGDAETLINAMEENAKNNPSMVFEIKRVLQDEDLVAVHSYARQHLTDPGAALVHIFRFVDGKIAELWDIVQAVPSEAINQNGMF